MAKQTKMWWESSVDAGQLSMRLKGLLVAVASVAVPALALAGVEAPQEGVDHVIEALVTLAQAAGVVYGIGVGIYGYLRKK